MTKILSKKLPALFLAVCVAAIVPAQAQTLIDAFSYAGGAFNPASYGGNFQPANFNPNAASDAGGNLAGSNWGLSGGLGSSSEPTYGGIYTMFSAPNFSFETSNVLEAVETISVSFLAGGGTVFNASTLTLDYNLGTQSLAAPNFIQGGTVVVETPIGEQTLTLYTWTWNVSALGPISSFDVNWASSVHTFYDQVTVTQAVPEPSTYVLIAMGLMAAVFLRKRLLQGTSF